MSGLPPGEVYWNQMLRLDNIALPGEPSCIPDLFVHLVKGSTPICFARVKVGDVYFPSTSWLHVLVNFRDSEGTSASICGACVLL